MPNFLRVPNPLSVLASLDGSGTPCLMLDGCTVAGGKLAKQKKSAPQARQEMTGLERLGLRVSSINHPIAQAQRWVTIHRLDTDGDMSGRR